MSLDIIIAEAMNLPVVTASANLFQTDTKPLLALILAHHDEIIENLNRYGFILFRGFSCQDEAYFSKAIELCALGSRCDTSDYDLPRTILQNEVYTSSDLPGHIPLPLHHEKPRSKNPPNHIYFCCVTPAEKGGGTVFANAESIWLDMPEPIKNKVTQYGVVYQQFFHGKTLRHAVLEKIFGAGGARIWSTYFGTDEKKQLEKKLTHDKAQWRWVNKGKDLVLSSYLPGVLTHPVTHRINWFNSAAYLNYYSNLLYGTTKKLPFYKYLASRYMILKDIFPMICHYGNGQAFSVGEIEEINQVIQKHTHVFQWQKGDFMIVDNFTFMHGKQIHEGNRLLYSCMTEREQPPLAHLKG